VIACLESGGGAGVDPVSGGGTVGSRGSTARAKPRAEPADVNRTRAWRPPSWAARFEVVAEAPDPAALLPMLDDPCIASEVEAGRRARERSIAAIQAELRAAGRAADRVIAAIIHDGERAPRSTNRRQLARIGIEPPTGADAVAALSDEACRRELWRTVLGLACLGIFLSSTDHLDDRRLLSFLASRVLDDAIHDVPPSDDMSEFIDLAMVSPDVDTDLNPADKPAVGCEDDRPEHAVASWPPCVDRDRLLPRPSRPAIHDAPTRGGEGRP
jgi:hypothetical protein